MHTTTCTLLKARAGGGAAEFLKTLSGPRVFDENLGKVKRQMQRSGMPSMADIRVAWTVGGVQHLAGTPGVDTIQAPATLRTVFRGDRLIVYAFVNDCFKAFLKARARTKIYQCI